MHIEIKPRSRPKAIQSAWTDIVSMLIDNHAAGNRNAVVVTLKTGEDLQFAGLAGHLKSRTRRIGGPFRLRRHQLSEHSWEFWIEAPEGITREELQQLYRDLATPRYRGSASLHRPLPDRAAPVGA